MTVLLCFYFDQEAQWIEKELDEKYQTLQEKVVTLQALVQYRRLGNFRKPRKLKTNYSVVYANAHSKGCQPQKLKFSRHHIFTTKFS